MGTTDRRRDFRTRTLFASTSEGLVALDCGGRIVLMNEAAERMLGCNRECTLGCTVDCLGLPQLTERVERMCEPGARVTSRPMRLISDKGVLSVSASRYKDRLGSGIGLVIRDDTELSAAQERAEAILAGAADGLVLFSPDERITYLNPAARQLLGRRGRGAVGRRTTVAALLGAEEDGEDIPVPRDGRVVAREYAVDGPKRRVVEARRKCLTDPEGRHIGCVVSLRDVTAEREISDMKSEFVSTVSHELRTPLTAIKGYVDLILEGEAGEINDIQREFLGIVQDSSDRLVSLINDMLDISRIESGRMHLRIEPIDLRGIALDVVGTFRAVAAQTGAELEVKAPKQLARAAGDRDRIGRVLTNMVSNAVKYSPNGGLITVSIRRRGDDVILSVEDHGMGISAEDQKLLFSKFYRVDSSLTASVGGSGLGLNICKRLIELHGGRIWVRSTPGQGSTFSIALPVAPGELVRTPQVEAPLAGGEGTVLVVDRDPEVAALIEGYLKKHGHEVILAHSAKEAWQKARSERPDAITLDVMLDDMDGFDLLQRLKDDPETAGIPVVVLSIVLDEARSWRLGAANYIEKPIDQKRLVKVIDDLVGSVESPVVLVVDDDRHIVATLSRMLRGKGFAVVGAYDGLEAMKAMEIDIPDLVLLDLRMPKMDGYQVIQAMKSLEATKHVPIVVMTAYRIDRAKTDVLSMAAEQVPKPFDAEHLVERVEEILGRRG